mmetsp:Transcript_18989/g.43692  ORF Transcript_18989/g.43692 Transcript_18989/m.43692 type:complete len:213 (+) Transcript_18989:658-1296(+)
MLRTPPPCTAAAAAARSCDRAFSRYLVLGPTKAACCAMRSRSSPHRAPASMRCLPTHAARCYYAGSLLPSSRRPRCSARCSRRRAATRRSRPSCAPSKGQRSRGPSQTPPSTARCFCACRCSEHTPSRHCGSSRPRARSACVWTPMSSLTGSAYPPAPSWRPSHTCRTSSPTSMRWSAPSIPHASSGRQESLHPRWRFLALCARGAPPAISW